MLLPWDMMKLNIVSFGTTDFYYGPVIEIFKEHFDFELFQTDKTYDKSTTIFAITRAENLRPEVFSYLEQGYPLLIVNLWEARPYFPVIEFAPYLDNINLILGCAGSYDYGWPNRIDVARWFWFHEALLYHNNPEYQYTPNPTQERLFLMPMKRKKSFRDQIKLKLDPFLDQALWSSAESWGITLPTEKQGRVLDRIFDPAWYDQTLFSVVVESAVDRQTRLELERYNQRDESLPCDVFITEKTYKPIAFGHPFIVCAMKDTVKYLKSFGFESYDNIFDESYDSLNTFNERLDLIYKNIEQFDISLYNSKLTQEKIAHNQNLFYNIAYIIQAIELDVVKPILEFHGKIH